MFHWWKILIGSSLQQSLVMSTVKFENVMFENRDMQNWTVKVIDFGLARVYRHRKMTARVGTIYTMSPETIDGKYTSKADLWSVGVCSYMLLSGIKPFWGKTRWVGYLCITKLL